MCTYVCGVACIMVELHSRWSWRAWHGVPQNVGLGAVLDALVMAFLHLLGASKGGTGSSLHLGAAAEATQCLKNFQMRVGQSKVTAPWQRGITCFLLGEKK